MRSKKNITSKKVGLRLKINKWDSAYFKQKIGDVYYHPSFGNMSCRDIQDEINKTVKRAGYLGFGYLVLDVPGGTPVIGKAALAQGFKLADRSTDHELILDKGRIKTSDKEYKIFGAGERDMPEVRKISGYSFMLSRMYKINFSTKSQVDKYHSVWVSNLYKGKNSYIFVPKVSNKVCGFSAVTIDTGSHSARIVLIAVSKRAKNKGIGTSLISHFYGWCKVRKIKKIYVKTQDENDVAIKLYKKFGFKVKQRDHKYHIYLPIRPA